MAFEHELNLPFESMEWECVFNTFDDEKFNDSSLNIGFE